MTSLAESRTLQLDPAPAPPQASDAELVAACLAGDARAERTLYQRHVDALYRVAYRLCGDPDVAADITQEAFVSAFNRLAQFRGESALRTWLIAIVASAAGMTLRKGRWFSARVTPLHDRIAMPARGDAGSDVAGHLDQAIAALSDKLRVVFVMHEVEGYTHEEIGAALAIPVGTSKARLFDARAKLRAALAHHGKDRLS